jgi:hypothetical protein
MSTVQKRKRNIFAVTNCTTHWAPFSWLLSIQKKDITEGKKNHISSIKYSYHKVEQNTSR